MHRMQTRSKRRLCHTLALLPLELAFEILTSHCLDAKSLIRSSQVCKMWNKFFDSDELWRKAARRWGYAPYYAITVEDAKRATMDENGYFARVKTWKDLCIAHDFLNAELGDGRLRKRLQYPLSYSFHAAQFTTRQGIYQDLWRMKVIAEDGTLVSTGYGGGIRVSDLRTHQLLWSEGPMMTARRPDLEADNGFLVWNADG
jgi:F-box-like